MHETMKFLGELFGAVDGLYFYVWSLPDKNTLWLGSLDEADKLVAPLLAQTAKKDVYVGVSLAKQAFGSKVRLKEDDGRAPAGIVGFWSDMDIAGPEHKKKNLPPTIEDASRLLHAAGMKPTATVHSGHGLQGWWLFKEPWLFDNEMDRGKAAARAEAWSQVIKRKAKDKGWEVDSVHDLTRVMRLPGGWNWKGEEPVQARIIEAEWGLRYSPDDFAVFEGDEIKIERPVYVCDNLHLAPDNNPTWERLEALLHNSPEFRRVWEHKKDLPSMSEYECSIARFAVMALWTDQEIANLLIAHRRKWDPAKLSKLVDRKDYITRIISVVRGDRDRDEAVRILAGAVADPEQEEQTNSGNAKSTGQPAKDTDLQRLSAAFGVKLCRWIQFGTERPIYTMELANGRQVRIGGVKMVTGGPKAFSDAFYVETRQVIPPIPKKAWPGICEALGRVCEVVEAPDVTDAAAARHGIEEYLRKKDVYDNAQRDIACIESAPFVEDGMVHVAVESLRKWLNFHSADRWDKSDLVNAMREIGFERRQVNYLGTHGKRANRHYWHIAAIEFPQAVSGAKEKD